MHPTARLSEEHVSILLGLDVLERIAERLGEDPAAVASDARLIVDFIRGFADELHHLKEEGMLFVAMEAAGHSRHAGPIGVMLAEHEEGRALVRSMIGALEDPQSGADTFEAAALSFAQLLRSHIMKEDHILFPMAEQTLSEATRADLVRRFGEHDEVVHGVAYRGHLDALARLAERYPG
ncbi:MAG: hemerythrin domain-containing protein [Sandaracinaceae bacterium]|nr:hemerythrin domain-containing protein [Sandaracinaceae bacterium]